MEDSRLEALGGRRWPSEVGGDESSGGGRWCWGEESSVPEQGPEHVDASAGKSDDGLDVLAALGSLLHVVIAVGAFTDDAGLGGEIEDAAETSAVALGAVKVAGAASRVAWNGH